MFNDFPVLHGRHTIFCRSLTGTGVYMPVEKVTVGYFPFEAFRFYMHELHVVGIIFKKGKQNKLRSINNKILLKNSNDIRIVLYIQRCLI